MKNLRKYLDTKSQWHPSKEGFPGNYTLEDLQSFLKENEYKYVRDYDLSNLNISALSSIAYYIMYNTPYSGTTGKLDKPIYYKPKNREKGFLAFVITKSDREDSLSCYLIDYQESTNTVVISAYNAQLEFDIKKLHKTYRLNSATVVEVKIFDDYENYKKIVNNSILNQ